MGGDTRVSSDTLSLENHSVYTYTCPTLPSQHIRKQIGLHAAEPRDMVG